MNYPITASVLALIATISPLLTIVHLWQLKEWRWDRLLEHVRREGTLTSLFSTHRLIIGALWITLGLTLQALVVSILDVWPMVLLSLLAAMTAAQLLLRKQPLPVWTHKAYVVFGASVLLAVIGIAACMAYATTDYDANLRNMIITRPYAWFILLLPYMQWPIVALAWLVTFPLDRYLKAKVMNRARAVRAAHQNLTVIGITGSVGKTTTKELLAHVLAGKTMLATPEHVNTEMGVSAWLTQTLAKQPSNSTATLIVEMGAYRLREIAVLCSIAQPTIGIITAIGEQHVGLFGSKEAICRAKGELFAALPSNGHAFLNADSEMCEQLQTMAPCPLTRIGTGGNGEVQAYDIEETGRGIRFVVDGTLFDVPLSGTHNVTNILLVIACARHIGMQMKDIASRLRNAAPKQRTFSIRTEHGVTILDDTYNSSPQSVEAAIAWAAQQPQTHKTLLISGIIELGEREADIHHGLASKARNVFENVYVVNKRFLPYFQQAGFGENAMVLSGSSKRMGSGSLLVCVGRMPQSSIERLLP